MSKEGRLTGSVEIVSIVLSELVIMNDVRVDSVVRDSASSSVIRNCESCSIVNGVLGEQQVSSWKAELLTRCLSCLNFYSDARSEIKCCCYLSSSFLGTRTWCPSWLEATWEAWERTRWCPDRWRGGRKSYCCCIWIVTGEVAREVRWFVHIDPETIEIKTRDWVEEGLEFYFQSVFAHVIRCLGIPLFQ